MDYFLKFRGFNLSVRNTDFYFRYIFLNIGAYLIDRLNPVVHKVNLPVPFNLVQYPLTHFMHIEGIDLCIDRLAIGRRRGDKGKVARAEKREIECSRYRSSG